eukprot:GEMP01010926.1.p1 GENE.GEMP01010926.1~~GEMP01010926.1.p1  ORF type:complete len:375 (+),score=66.68 GEMP01010926.1:268-1392(+)
MQDMVRVKNTFIEWASEDIAVNKKVCSSWTLGVTMEPSVPFHPELTRHVSIPPWCTSDKKGTSTCYSWQQTPYLSCYSSSDQEPEFCQLDAMPTLMIFRPADESPAQSEGYITRGKSPSHLEVHHAVSYFSTPSHSGMSSGDQVESELSTNTPRTTYNLSDSVDNDDILSPSMCATTVSAAVIRRCSSNDRAPTVKSDVAETDDAPADISSITYISSSTTVTYSTTGDAPFLDAGVVTVTIRNLARSVNLTALLATLDASGFQGKYDFAHIPFRAERGNNLGFAFLNFCTPQYAQEFSDRRQKMNAIVGPKSRRLSMAPSKKQGRDWSIQRIVECLKGKTADPSYCPIAFLDGRIVSFSLEIATQDVVQRLSFC